MKRYVQVVLVVLSLSLVGCTTVIRRTAIENPVEQDRAVGIVVNSDQDGTLPAMLRASLVERGYRTLLLSDQSAVPSGAATSGSFNTLEDITQEIAETGEVGMGASQFQEFLQNTNFDSSTAYLSSYADMLSYLGEQRGLDVLLVVNNRNALRVWAYAYDLDADTVIFSYYLATDARSFPSVVPPAAAESSDGWTAEVTGPLANNSDARAIDIAEDITTLLAGE